MVKKTPILGIAVILIVLPILLFFFGFISFDLLGGHSFDNAIHPLTTPYSITINHNVRDHCGFMRDGDNWPVFVHDLTQQQIDDFFALGLTPDSFGHITDSFNNFWDVGFETQFYPTQQDVQTIFNEPITFQNGLLIVPGSTSEGSDNDPCQYDLHIEFAIDDTSFCGDGTCGSGENSNNCPSDCGFATICGNNVCETGETAGTCPSDCGLPTICGNNICETGETAGTCPGDCGDSGIDMEFILFIVTFVGSIIFIVSSISIITRRRGKGRRKRR